MDRSLFISFYVCRKEFSFSDGPAGGGGEQAGLQPYGGDGTAHLSSLLFDIDETKNISIAETSVKLIEQRQKATLFCYLLFWP
jgi:hypothetical protein